MRRNIAPGQSGLKVIVGLRGTVYFMEEEDKVTKLPKKVLKTLEPKNLRGIDNDAMCMSAFELGINDEHEGIILLEDDAPVGVPLQEFMGDAIVEIDVLPNMARCLGILGVAREVAALTGQKAIIPAVEPKALGEPVEGNVKVVIADPKLCARYTAQIVRNATVGPAPGWMQRRLDYAGMRPINNVVDATNYVMLLWGQPLHAFDYDVLVKRAGGEPVITVRPAHPGEQLRTLDNQDRELTPDHLVIADAAGPIALAGVMGGRDTEVTAATKSILLESASFDFVSIRKTAKHFDLHSEASRRFSRGIHPDIVLPAGRHAAELLRLHAGGEVLVGVVDVYPAPLPTQVVTLRRAEVQRLLGVAFGDDEVERVLTSLEFRLERTADGWTVTVPPTRLDVQAGAADLIEELARIRGYDRLPTTLLSGELPPQNGNPRLDFEDGLRDLLVSAGLQEVANYSLTSVEKQKSLGFGLPYVELLNPISPERGVMRKTLLAGMLDSVAHNLKHTNAVRLFELGPVYVAKEGERLPDEPRRLAVAVVGPRAEPAWDGPQGVKPATADFYDLKGVVEDLFVGLHARDVRFELAKDETFLHPARAAVASVGGKKVGAFGELHPRVALTFDLADRGVLIGEFDVELLERSGRPGSRSRRCRRFRPRCGM